MKGIIFNLLERAVSAEYGDETWDTLLDDAGSIGTYTAVGNYPDEELMALVGAATQRLGLSSDELIRWFGRRAIPMLEERYPAFFEAHRTTRDFLLTLNDVIHPEVRKLFPGAYAPSFEFDTSREDALGLTYESHRNLCSFAEGLIEGSAERFGDTVTIEQPRCTKRGDDVCLLHVTFGNGAH
jgi:hypothetical protein